MKSEVSFEPERSASLRFLQIVEGELTHACVEGDVPIFNLAGRDHPSVLVDVFMYPEMPTAPLMWQFAGHLFASLLKASLTC